jgi:hypothetical protein
VSSGPARKFAHISSVPDTLALPRGSRRNFGVGSLGPESASAPAWRAFRSGGDSGMTVTVCQDKAGTDESSRRAAEWVKENVSTTGSPPVITEGSTVLQFSS